MKIHRGSRLGVYRDQAEAVAFAKGTTVRVSNLFANLPVRRKQALLETRAMVMQRLKRLLVVPLALCPHVTLSVCSGGERAVHVPVHRREDVPRMVQVLEMLHGKGVVADWANIEYEHESDHVRGVVGVWGGPAAARPREILLRRRDRFDDAITHREVQKAVGDDARFYMLFVETRETRASSVRQMVLGTVSSTAAAQDGASSTASPRRPKHGLRMSPTAPGRKRDIPRLHPALGVSGHFGTDDVLTRMDLQMSHAVAQFNSEFVLVRIDRADGGAPVLAVLDPHAADERIRFEEQLAGLCSKTAVEAVPLQTPVELAVTEADTAALDTYRPALERWGARFDIANTRLVVRGLPLVLAARPDLVSAAAGLVQHARDLRDSVDTHATPANAAVPSIVRAAVGTAACHSAIRFGDRITPQEAQSLLARLSRCSQPFSCIHGRPSVVPLYALAPRK